MTARSASLFVFCVGLVRATVYSCSPPPETPLCQFPNKIDITFIGTPIATNYDPNPPGGGDLAFLKMWYRFTVKERFTGLRPDEKQVVVWLSLGGGSPQIGRSFFVHAERKGNQIRLAPCGNTRPVEDADSDVRYLRQRGQNTFTPYIAGSVLRHYKGSQYAIEAHLDGAPRGLPNAGVKLKSGKGSLAVTTDEQGRFRIDGVLPGHYVVTAASPGYIAAQAYPIDVPNGGCGIAHMGMFTNSRISGVVMRADGTPAEKVRLDLIDAEPGYRATTDILDMIETGQGGEFSRDRLPSGRFLLGVNIKESSRYPDRTPPTYYPGVADRSRAQIIELGPNEIKTGVVLRLLPPVSSALYEYI